MNDPAPSAKIHELDAPIQVERLRALSAWFRDDRSHARERQAEDGGVAHGLVPHSRIALGLDLVFAALLFAGAIFYALCATVAFRSRRNQTFVFYLLICFMCVLLDMRFGSLLVGALGVFGAVQ